MKRLVALLALPLLTSCEPAGIEIEDAWARDTVGRTTNAAVFMTISSGKSDRLLGASTVVAGRTDLMTMTSAGGAMGMKYLQSIDLPAGSKVRLDPSGLHVWLADLKQPLRAGESIPLTLRFEFAGERQVMVTVIKPPAAPPRSGN